MFNILRHQRNVHQKEFLGPRRQFIMSPLSFLPSFLPPFLPSFLPSLFFFWLNFYVYIYIYFKFGVGASLQSMGFHRGPPASVSWMKEWKECIPTPRLSVQYLVLLISCTLSLISNFVRLPWSAPSVSLWGVWQGRCPIPEHFILLCFETVFPVV